MRDLDDIDRELLRLLLEDARRPFSDLAERVDLSPPAVSDRVDRLEELGVIRGFTVDIDRTQLQDGVSVLVTFEVEPGSGRRVRSTLEEHADVESVVRTADNRILVVATMPDVDVERHFAETFETSAIHNIEAVPVVESEWLPSVTDVTLGLECVECGNTVTSEGVTGEISGRRYEFCCPSCHVRFEERYDEIKEGA